VSIIRFICPNCKAALSAPDAKVGAKAHCTKCGQRIQVPGASPNQTVIGQLIPDKGQVTKLLDGFCAGEDAIQVFNSVFGYRDLVPLTTPEVQELLRRNWKSLTADDFEHFLVEVFQSLGYQAKKMGRSNDKGLDILLEVGSKAARRPRPRFMPPSSTK
jgi:DNA-directed RNA polymerase subunit RPC12/RpoP